MQFNNLNYNFIDSIGIFENYFEKKDCENAIKLFEFCQKEKIFYQRKSKNVNSANYNSIDLHTLINLEDGKKFLDILIYELNTHIYPIYSEKYSILNSLKKHNLDSLQIQKTSPGEGYHSWHCEHDGDINFKERILSWILYLNDVCDGGETEFLYQSLRIKPSRGTFILFPAFFTHTHRGNPPLKESKYIVTGWINFIGDETIKKESNEKSKNIKLFDYK